ncbi:hypothetical protein M1373_01500 [Candidatus Marsarchaeota archaeon]|nr:hypothetical protein [Candidatus Marsarchaeota archaeon]MCL5404973.1 hypothetical protein [Candidatus Marsarchaeota archaeon]
MLEVLGDSAGIYKKHIKLIWFFSISFLIAVLIPLLAPFPTYNDLGSILLRTGSIYLNLNLFDAAVIIAATIFSLIFLSFAIVAINTIVKHSRTVTRIKGEVIRSLEKNTSNVFIVLLAFTAIPVFINFITYYTGYSGIITAIVVIILIPFLFYAPTSIVIDENRPVRAIQASLHFMRKKFAYFVLWLLAAFIILSVVDLVPIAFGGASAAAYAALIIDSFFALPFLVVLQSETYIRRFAMLKR